MRFDTYELCAASEQVRKLLDDAESPRVRPEWLDALQIVGQSLGSSTQAVKPFITAWQGLYTVTNVLDHLQDADSVSPQWFAALPSALQYQLIFTSYAHLQQMAAEPYLTVPNHRVVRLHQLWSSLAVEMAEGQLRDLTETVATIIAAGRSPLDAYEMIIEQKAGSLFGLGFGGVATLATDDEAQITAAVAAGKLFGMLLQYGDDLIDAEEQEREYSTLTLPRALKSYVVEERVAVSPERFWASIYRSYARALPGILAPLPASARDAIRSLVAKTFANTRTSPEARATEDEAQREP